MILRTERMIAQHLDDPATGNSPLSTLRDHPLQLRFQRRQARDARLDSSELLLRNNVGGCTGLIRPVREAQQIADCVERKPKLARVADERQSILCRLPVEPLIAGAALWRRQKPDLLIVADRGNLHPGRFAQLSVRKSSSALLNL